MARKYTLEQIREFIACPELGDDHYGKWGAMTREQRLVMNDLIELAKEFEDSPRQQKESQKAEKNHRQDGYFLTTGFIRIVAQERHRRQA